MQERRPTAEATEAPVRSGASPRLYQRALDILARQIESGAIPGGARLLESRVTERLGISRAPARRALAALAERGLIEKAKGHGYTVVHSPSSPTAAPIGPAEPVILSSLPTWEAIYDEVERAIAARISFASWRVIEAKLASHYGVSRTVARDVLGRLQQRGVVRKDERTRWHATALTPTRVGELYELRWLLEPVALAKAAPHAPAEEIRRMRCDLEAALAAAGSIGGETLDRLEEELHIALLGRCDSDTLMQAITLPQSLLIAHRFLYECTSRLHEVEPFLAEHLEVVQRLEAGRIDEAARALEHHLKVSRDRAIARIDVVASAFNPAPLPYLDRID